MRIAAQLIGQEDIMIDTVLILKITSDTPEHIEKGLQFIKNSYRNNNINGIGLVRKTGIQLQTLESLLLATSADSYHNTYMSTVAGDRLFMPSSGFSDPYGIFVGTDINSLIYNNTAIIDFSGIKNAIVFMGEVAPKVSVEGYEGTAVLENGGSAVAHVIADGQYLSSTGGRTHHIVISKFDYQTTDSL